MSRILRQVQEERRQEVMARADSTSTETEVDIKSEIDDVKVELSDEEDIKSEETETTSSDD